MKENGGATITPSFRTSRLHISIILSIFIILSIYSVNESDADLLLRLSSESSSPSSAQNRRQLISDNVWEAELRERQLRATGTGGSSSSTKKKQRAQIERKRMLGEDVASGLPSRKLKNGNRGPPQRYLNKHHFEECVGLTIALCQEKINTYVAAHSAVFNNMTSLHLSVRKLREQSDTSYYKVVLTTNVQGTLVEGIYGDGTVYYPWGWQVSGDTIEIGPWDCASKTPEECCFIIQTDVPMMDDQGNYIACFVEEPVGGANNPERKDRAIAVADSGGIIQRAPIYH